MSATIKDILKSFYSSASGIVVNGLSGGAKGFFISRVALKFKDRPILIVTESQSSLKSLADDISFFLPSYEISRLKLFQESDINPYSGISP